MKKRDIVKLVIIITLIVFSLVGIASGYLKTEYGKKPIVEEKVGEKDWSYLYSFYMGSDPKIDERPVLGMEQAPITLIAYLDTTSPTTKTFIEETYPWLDENYIGPGHLQVIPKYHLTIQDVEDKTERFKNVQTLECIRRHDERLYMDAFFALGTGEGNATTVMRSSNMTGQCGDVELTRFMKEDVSEVEHFGIGGLNPRLYLGFAGKGNTIFDGIPARGTLQNTIRDYQTMIGE